MMNPNSVMPLCVRFMLSPSPRWIELPERLRDVRAHPREIHATRLFVPVEPDQEGLAAEVLLRQEVHRPETAVLAIITIVAHHEIVAGRHHPFALSLDGERRVLAFQDGVRAPRQFFLPKI